MNNRDKRSLVLLLCLGDGCLHYIRNHGRIYGGITIDHGLDQADYQAWKAQLLSTAFNKDVKVRTGHKGKSVQVSLCVKRLRAWRKFTYPNNKKSISKLLKFINHPELALAVWLMDDGYVERSHNNSNKLSYTAFRLFTCDQTLEDQEKIMKWLKDNFQIESKIRYQKKGDKKYPFIKFDQKSSLEVWKRIRDFVLTFKSMKHKFRFIEESYQIKSHSAQQVK